MFGDRHRRRFESHPKPLAPVVTGLLVGTTTGPALDQNGSSGTHGP